MRIAAVNCLLNNKAQNVIRKSFYNHLVWLRKTKGYDIDLLVTTSTELEFINSGIKKTLDKFDINIISLTNCDSNKKELERLEDYDYVYCIGVLRDSLLGTYKKYMEDDDFDIQSITYMSTISMMKKVLPILHLMKKGTKVVQYIVDWQEIDLWRLTDDKSQVKQISYYPNKAKWRNVQENPMYQYYIMRLHEKAKQMPKEYDFIFGYTVFDESRKDIEKIMTRLQRENGKTKYKIFVKNNKTGVNTLVSQEDYIEYQRKAKFSMVVPSYETTEFSMMRFMDCIFADCVPLIYQTCNLECFYKNGMLDVVSWYKRNFLIVGGREISEKYLCEFFDYDRLIKELKELPSIKKFFDKEYYKDKLDIIEKE